MIDLAPAALLTEAYKTPPRIQTPLLRRPSRVQMQDINCGYEWWSTWRLFVELEGCVVELSHIREREWGYEVALLDGRTFMMTADRLTEWYGQLWKGYLI